MKLKYKKMILLTILSTMGVGMLTLSVSHDHSQTKESLSTDARNEADLSEIAKNNQKVYSNSNSNEKNKYITTPAITPTLIPSITPTLEPTPTLAVTELKKNDNTKINQLFLDYFAAKLTKDKKKLKNLLTNPDEVMTQEQMEDETKYIEEFRNIQCYTKVGLQKGSYVVYVYVEIKFINIDTTTPTIRKFYVVTDEEGKLKIYSDELTNKLKEFYDARNQDSDVQSLIEKTNKKAEKAKEKDKELKEFCSILDQLAK